MRLLESKQHLAIDRVILVIKPSSQHTTHRHPLRNVAMITALHKYLHCTLHYCYFYGIIGVGSGAAGAALAAPIFCLVGVLGQRFFSIRQSFVL